MNIALFAQSGIFKSLQAVVRWCTAKTPPAISGVASPSQSDHRIAPQSIADSEAMAGARSFSCRTTVKPLRVVRVVEAGQSRSSVGRIVISGRMADVCAELDRLVAREAALS